MKEHALGKMSVHFWNLRQKVKAFPSCQLLPLPLLLHTQVVSFPKSQPCVIMVAMMTALSYWQNLEGNPDFQAMALRVLSLALVAEDVCGSSRQPFWYVYASRKQVLYLLTRAFWFSFFSLFSQTINLQFLLYQAKPSWLLNIKTPTSSISSLIYGSQLYLAHP